MYSIINTKTNKFVYATDRRYQPPHQRTSDKEMIIYPDLYQAKHDFLFRKCGADYKIAEIDMPKVKRLIEPAKSYDELDWKEMEY